MSSKNIKKLIVTTVVLVYVFFSLINLSNSTKNESLSENEKIAIHKHITINMLKLKFNATEFKCNSLNIIGKNVIIDTTLIGSYKEKDVFSLKAKINIDCKEKYFVKLICSEKLFNQATKSKNGHLILVAKINSYNYSKIELEAETFDKKFKTINEDNYILSGECLSILETNYI